MKQIVDDRRFGCTDAEYVGQLGNYAVQHDNEAFSRALSAGVMLGQCTFFRSGESVYQTDVKVFSGLVKVRRPGETIEYWTNSEAVR